MTRKLAALLVLLLGACLPGVASAAIKVTISDGVTTATPATPRGFNLSKASPAGGNATLMLLGDCSATSQTGCTRTRHFPSGSATAQTGDTFRIQDISSTNRARVDKVDVPAGGTATTGADTLELKGIKVTALAPGAGKTFTLTYETEQGDFSTITSSSGNYAAQAKVKGSFRVGSSGLAAACKSGVGAPCVKIELQINLLTLNGAGSSATVTASAPCSTNSTSPDFSVSPCGSGGFWNPGALTGDQFFSSDTGSVGCGTTCPPVQKGTMTAKFSAQNEVLLLTNSASTGVAVDTPQGLVDLAAQLGEPGIDLWVGSCGGLQTGAQPFRVTGLPPLNNATRSKTETATFPLKFALEVANLVPEPGGFTMTSISDPAESVLPLGDRERNDACSMSWVPSPSSRPALREITELTLNYTAFVVGAADSGDPRLGILDFADCRACFRVEIELVDRDGVAAGRLKVYLGANAADNHKTDHAGSQPPLVLVSDPGLRVDPSGVTAGPEPCCITFAQARSPSKYGRLIVRSITVLVDRGEDVTPTNHRVTGLETIVNGNSSGGSLLVAGSFAPSCEWPPADGLRMAIYKVVGTARQFVHNVVAPTVEACQLKGMVNVGDLAPDPVNPTTYEVHVLSFSGATDPATEFVGGVSLPFPGVMTLR